ncbi:MAG: hypothetical protein ACLF0G_14430 [Candidatus Brocadiia bacterium]
MRSRILLLVPLACAAARAGAMAPPPRPAPRERLRLTRIRFIDKQVSGEECFTVLIPRGWVFRGGLTWDLNRPAMPARLAYTVTSPTGFERLTALADRGYYWCTMPLFQEHFPPGSTYMGSEVRKPLSPEQALRRLIIPEHLKGATDVRVIDIRRAPGSDKPRPEGENPPGTKKERHTAHGFVTYTAGGWPMLEYLTATVETTTVPMGDHQGIIWTVTATFGFRAPRQTFALQAKNYLLILKSFRPNKKWLAGYKALVGVLAKERVKRIKHIGQLAKIMREAQAEITERVEQVYQYRTTVLDAAVQEFCDYILSGNTPPTGQVRREDFEREKQVLDGLRDEAFVAAEGGDPTTARYLAEIIEQRMDNIPVLRQ